MIQAYILVQTHVGTAREVADNLSKLPSVESVAAVTGAYDVIALISVTKIDELSDVLANHIQVLPNITRTLTCSVLPGVHSS